MYILRIHGDEDVILADPDKGIMDAVLNLANKHRNDGDAKYFIDTPNIEMRHVRPLLNPLNAGKTLYSFFMRTENPVESMSISRADWVLEGVHVELSNHGMIGGNVLADDEEDAKRVAFEAVLTHVNGLFEHLHSEIRGDDA